MRTTSDVAVTSTFETSEAVECGFDPDGAAHLMSILSNLYRDAPMAVLREYAANARDSHVQAGNPDPIEVKLPSAWDPTLTIRDRGVGLSEQDILTVYASYGKSTKRDNDDEIGAFGIGAKAAFTISTQFTVTASKDGTKTTALFALNADGVGTVDIKARTSTTEPNGVSVTIPVDNPDAAQQAAKTLFATWQPGSVVVDGEQPEYLPDAMLTVSDYLYARQHDPSHDDTRTGVTVVMGGIPYPASAAMLHAAARKSNGTVHTTHRIFQDLAAEHARMHLLAVVPVGAVDITPSREDLRDTPRTVAKLAQIVDDYASQISAAVERELQAQPTAMHASTRFRALRGFLPAFTRNITWRGQHLASSVEIPHPVIHLVSSGSSHKTKSERSWEVHLGQSFERVLAITGVDDKAEKSIRRLARRYMTQHQDVSALLLLPNEQGEIGWFSYGGASPLAVMSAHEFTRQAAALPSLTSSARTDTTYHVWADKRFTQWSGGQLKRAVEAGYRLLILASRYCPDEGFIDGALAPTDLLVRLSGQQTTNGLYRRVAVEAQDATTLFQEHARRVLDQATNAERLALDYTGDGRIGDIEEMPELHELAPVKALIAGHHERRAAYRRIDAQRLRVLKDARIALGQEHDSYITRELARFPLLRMLLRDLPPYLLRARLDEEVCEHLALYTEAVQPPEQQHQHAA